VLDHALGMNVDRRRVKCPNGMAAVFVYEGGQWQLQTWGGGL